MRAAITVLPGDGIGPEVVAQATRVLAAVSRKAEVLLERERASGGQLPDAE